MAFILTRPLGATVGDLLTKTFAHGGINLVGPQDRVLKFSLASPQGVGPPLPAAFPIKMQRRRGRIPQKNDELFMFLSAPFDETLFN